jgi:hypothetical protein
MARFGMAQEDIVAKDASTQQGDQSDQERIGGIAGLGAGMLTGAKIGAQVVPIPAVGLFAGAVVGGVVGNEVGKRIGKALVNGASAFARTIADG